jgi:hypothetical protein
MDILNKLPDDLKTKIFYFYALHPIAYILQEQYKIYLDESNNIYKYHKNNNIITYQKYKSKNKLKKLINYRRSKNNYPEFIPCLYNYKYPENLDIANINSTVYPNNWSDNDIEPFYIMQRIRHEKKSILMDSKLYSKCNYCEENNIYDKKCLFCIECLILLKFTCSECEKVKYNMKNGLCQDCINIYSEFNENFESGYNYYRKKYLQILNLWI